MSYYTKNGFPAEALYWSMQTYRYLLEDKVAEKKQTPVENLLKHQ